MSPDSISITASAAANIAIGYLQLANLRASPFLLSMRHTAYMALSSVLLVFKRVLPAGPRLATSCAAALNFADVCAAHVLVAIGGFCMGGVVFWWIISTSRKMSLEDAFSNADTLGSVCSLVCTLGTDICGVVTGTLGSGCFVSIVSLDALIRSLITLTS